MVSVHFVDYGDSEEVDVKNIRVLPEEFLQLPFQGVRCQLAGKDTLSSVGACRSMQIRFSEITCAP